MLKILKKYEKPVARIFEFEAEDCMQTSVNSATANVGIGMGNTDGCDGFEADAAHYRSNLWN